MTRFIYSFQMDFPLRETVLHQQHYDIGDLSNIKAADFTEFDDSPAHNIDWQDLRAIFPIDDGSDYKAVVLYRRRGLLVVRNTPAYFLDHVIDAQCLRYKSDMVRAIGPALKIKRFMPYVCGDLVLLPIRRNHAAHTGWIRIGPDATFEQINSKQASISYTDVGPVRFDMSPWVHRSRLETLNQIRYHMVNYATAIVPNQIPQALCQDPKECLSEQEFRDQLNKAQFKSSVKKVTGEQIPEELLDEANQQLHKNNFRALDDEALG